MDDKVIGKEAEKMALELSAKLGAKVTPMITFRTSEDSRKVSSYSSSSTQGNATWGLDRIDQRSLPLNSTYGYSQTGAGVKVYVVDSGILGTHNDFTGRVSDGYSAFGGLGSQDCNGHGTHVAGTIGGTVYGVAKEVSLVPVRVMDCFGYGSEEEVVAGIMWAISDHTTGPAVMNLSLGSPPGEVSQILNAAVKEAYDDGIVVVVASGNDSYDACYTSPASEPTAITVNSSTITDDDSFFSNFGSCTDIYAPGENIRSTYIDSDSSSATLSGTSMASPHVAGAAALVLAQSPGDNPAQVWNKISNSASPFSGYYDQSDAKIILFTGQDSKTFQNIPTPVITGALATGATLTGNPGAWDATCDCSPTLSFTWLRNGSQISNANETTYVLQAADSGKRITFRVTAEALGYSTVSIESSQTSPIAQAFTTSTTPSITGTPTSGQTLRVNTGSWSPRPSFRYQWNCDGQPISRATSSSLRLATSHNGCDITVTVTASARNIATTSLTSNAIGPVLRR